MADAKVSKRNRQARLRPLPTTMGRIAALPAAAGSSADEYQHPHIKALRLRVTRTGSRSWDVYRRVNGRQVRHTIGRFPDVSLALAGKMAAQLVGEMAAGTYKPKTQTAAAGMTLEEAFEEYLKERAKDRDSLAKSTVTSYRCDFEQSFADWRRRPVSSLTAEMIVARHAERSKVAPARADGAIRLIRAVINFMIDIRGVSPGTLPHLRGLMKRRWNSPEARTDHIQPSQVPAWFTEAGKHGGTGRALQVLLLTGLRRNELLEAKREQLDLTAGTLTVAQNKSHRLHVIPLAGLTQSILREQLAAHPRSKWIFPQSGRLRARGDQPLGDPRKTLRLVCLASGVDEALTIHGLRRTFSTLAARHAGVLTLKRLMNHATGKDVTERHYVQRDVAEMRRAIEAVALECAK